MKTVIPHGNVDPYGFFLPANINLARNRKIQIQWIVRIGQTADLNIRNPRFGNLNATADGLNKLPRHIKRSKPC